MDEEFNEEQRKVLGLLRAKKDAYARKKALLEIFCFAFLSITLILLLISFIVPHSKEEGFFGRWVFYGPFEGSAALSIIFGLIASIVYRKELMTIEDIRVTREQYRLDNKEKEYI